MEKSEISIDIDGKFDYIVQFLEVNCPQSTS